MRKVVITGMGAVTPVGNNVNDMWEAVKAGKCGIGKITHFNTENSAVKLAGEVKGFDAESIVDKAELRKMDDFTIYALAAADEAVKDSAIDFGKEDTLSCGCGKCICTEGCFFGCYLWCAWCFRGDIGNYQECYCRKDEN